MSHYKELKKETADAAAKWWAEQIGRHHDNGDKSLGSIFSGMLADMMSEPCGKDAIDKFAEILSKKIMDDEFYETYFNIGCDYAPDTILADSAKEAGINCNNFPWKVTMCIFIKENKIEVRDGYGRGWRQIYPN